METIKTALQWWVNAHFSILLHVPTNATLCGNRNFDHRQRRPWIETRLLMLKKHTTSKTHSKTNRLDNVRSSRQVKHIKAMSLGFSHHETSLVHLPFIPLGPFRHPQASERTSKLDSDPCSSSAADETSIEDGRRECGAVTALSFFFRWRLAGAGARWPASAETRDPKFAQKLFTTSSAAAPAESPGSSRRTLQTD